MRSFLNEFYNNKRADNISLGFVEKNIELFPVSLGLSLSLVSNLHEIEAGCPPAPT